MIGLSFILIGIAGICNEDAAAEEEVVELTANVVGGEVGADPAETGGQGAAIAAANARGGRDLASRRYG